MDNRTLEEVRKNETKLIEEIKSLEKQLEYLRSGEYYNQLRFERDMLQDLVDKKEISKEDKEFIDMTHRNTELLKENKQLKEEKRKVRDYINKHCVNEKISKEVGYKCYTMADTNELEKIMKILGGKE